MNNPGPPEPVHIFSKHRLFLDMATAASVVTLNYIPLIRRYVFADAKDAYFLPAYTSGDYLAGLIVITGLSLLCFLAIRVVRKCAHPALFIFASSFIFIALINPLHLLRLTLQIAVRDVSSLVFHSSLIVEATIWILILVAVLLFFRFYWQVFRALRMVFVVASPFAVLVTLQLAWHSVTSLARDDGALAEDGRSAASSTLDPDSSTPDAAKSGKATRMLVIVFDGLDYRLAFPERPEFTDLPELDRFSKQAIVFTNAPAAETHTLKAIPTLLVGKRISGAQVRDRKTLVLTVEGAEEGRSLSSLPNLFSEVRNSGHTLSIVGFYHPDCRLFRGLYAECMRLTLNDPYHREDQGGTTGNFRRRFEAALMFGSPLAHKTGAMRNYGIVLQRVKEMVHRFDVNLIYVHLQVPHTPFIYDARRRRMTSFNFSITGYFDNLALVDNFLGEIRRTMEGAGLWEGTAVLLTSDHPWREANQYDGKTDSRIPVLLKMPGQKDAVVYDNEFPPEHIKDLVSGVMAKRLMDRDAVLAWADKRQ